MDYTWLFFLRISATNLVFSSQYTRTGPAPAFERLNVDLSWTDGPCRTGSVVFATPGTGTEPNRTGSKTQNSKII